MIEATYALAKEAITKIIESEFFNVPNARRDAERSAVRILQMMKEVFDGRS